MLLLFLAASVVGYITTLTGLVLAALVILIGVCVSSPTAPVEFVSQVFNLPDGNTLSRGYYATLSSLDVWDTFPHGWPYTWQMCVRDQWMPYAYLGVLASLFFLAAGLVGLFIGAFKTLLLGR